MTQHNPAYEVTDQTEVRGVDIYIKNCMTEYEMERFKQRAKKFLDAVENAKSGIHSYPVDSLYAYGNLRRIGARMKVSDDPLGNGIVVGNIDGFSVEAIRPVHGEGEETYIRFQENEAKTDFEIEITGIDTDQLDAVEGDMPEHATVENDLDEMLYRKFAEGYHVDFDDVTVRQFDQ